MVVRFKREENTAGKGEIVHCMQLPLFPQSFQTCRNVKIWICMGKGQTNSDNMQ